MSIWKDFRRDSEDGFEAFMLIVINGAMYVVPMAIIAGCILLCTKSCDKSQTKQQKTEQYVQKNFNHQQLLACNKNTLVLSKSQLNKYIKSR